MRFLGAKLKNVRAKDRPYSRSGKNMRRQRVQTFMMVNAPITDIKRKLKENGFMKGAFSPTGQDFLVYQDHGTILRYYNSRVRGLLNYYSFAGNRAKLNKIVWILKASCALTLAKKYKGRTIAKAFKRFGSDLMCPDTKETFMKVGSLKVKHEYKKNMEGQLEMEKLFKERWLNITRTGLGETCVICGDEKVEMHHVRSVKDVRMKIRKGESKYEEIVGAMKRKQVPLCERHHKDLHEGRLTREEMQIVQDYTS